MADKFTIEKLEQMPIEKYGVIVENLVKYKQISGRHNIGLYNIDRHPGAGFAANIFTAIILLPVFIFGLVTNMPVYFPLRLFLNKKVKDPQFHSSIKYGVGITLVPIYYLVLSALTLIWADPIWVLYSFLILVLSALITIKYKNMIAIIIRQFRFLKMKVFNKKDFLELRLIKRRMENLVTW